MEELSRTSKVSLLHRGEEGPKMPELDKLVHVAPFAEAAS